MPRDTLLQRVPEADDIPGCLPRGYRLNEFVIDRVIAEGGFGVVYSALDLRIKRRVAIKEYMPSALARRAGDFSVQPRSSVRHQDAFAAGLKSFINEARLLGQFDHPSLVRVLQFWEDKGTGFIVMPLYDAPTLKAWLAGNPPPDEAWLRRFLDNALDALATLHGANCLHRDIAPDNILVLKENDKPLLLDFGAARRVLDELTQTLTVIVKPGFAPIEQYAEVTGMKQGPWTDIYALCATAYAVITRRPPPPAVGRIVADQMTPLVELAQGRYSPALLAALDAGLAVRPEHRPPSVDVMRTLLGECAEGNPDRTMLLQKPRLEAAADRAGADMIPDGARAGGEAAQHREAPVHERTVWLDAIAAETTKHCLPVVEVLPTRRVCEIQVDPDRTVVLPARRAHAASAGATDPRARVADEPMQRRREDANEPRDDAASRHLDPVADEAEVLLQAAIACEPAPLPAAFKRRNRILELIFDRPLGTRHVAVTFAVCALIGAGALAASAFEFDRTPLAPAATPEVRPITIAPHSVADTTAANAEAPVARANDDWKIADLPQAAPAPPPAVVAVSTVPVRPVQRAAVKPAAFVPSSARARGKSASAASVAKSSASKAAAPAREPKPVAAAAPQTTRQASAPISVPTVADRAVATVDLTYAAMQPSLAHAPAGVVAPPPAAAAAEASTPAPLLPIDQPRPRFAVDAARRGITQGRVLARLSVEADGRVGAVRIVESSPHRVFDREVRHAALQWRYQPPGERREVDVEFVFRTEG